MRLRGFPEADYRRHLVVSVAAPDAIRQGAPDITYM